VAKARPLFREHIQPKLPGELGFYGLRLDRTRSEQATLAKQYGVHGICYWHYWLGGKCLLETPIEQVLETKKLDFPFCLGWANEIWTGVWHGFPHKTLIEQVYPEGDPERHYELLRRFFRDERYIKNQEKPLLFIYRLRDNPRLANYLKTIRELACSDGFPGLHIVGQWSPNLRGRFDSATELGLDAAAISNITGRDSLARSQRLSSALEKSLGMIGGPIGPRKVPYSVAMKHMLPYLRRFAFAANNVVISNWDNTPRSGRRGLVYTESSPELFRKALGITFPNLASRPSTYDTGEFIFLKFWNEWAEGNYVKPDQLFKRKYLEAISAAFLDHGLTPC
jgi:hypothetical protein